MQPRGGRAAEPAPPRLPQSRLPPAEAYISAAPPYSLQEKKKKPAAGLKHGMPFCQAPAPALHLNNIQSWKSEQSRSPTYLEAFHQGGEGLVRGGLGAGPSCVGLSGVSCVAVLGGMREPAPTDREVTRRISFSFLILSFIAFSFATYNTLIPPNKTIQ